MPPAPEVAGRAAQRHRVRLRLRAQRKVGFESDGEHHEGARTSRAVQGFGRSVAVAVGPHGQLDRLLRHRIDGRHTGSRMGVSACAHRFTCSIREMVKRPQSPRCENERRAASQKEYDALTKTAVADHPMLAVAWDDLADPRSVPIAGGWELRRFKCPNGYHPRISPHTFPHSGCPHCRSAETRKTSSTRTLAEKYTFPVPGLRPVDGGEGPGVDRHHRLLKPRPPTLPRGWRRIGVHHYAPVAITDGHTSASTPSAPRRPW